MEILQKTKESVKETNKQIISQTMGFISSAFVLVAALAWNEAIKELITTYVPTNSGIFTIIAIVITSRLNKISEKYK
jgi:hypothetical protein